jgi:hypothetical protein
MELGLQNRDMELAKNSVLGSEAQRFVEGRCNSKRAQESARHKRNVQGAQRARETPRSAKPSSVGKQVEGLE